SQVRTVLGDTRSRSAQRSTPRPTDSRASRNRHGSTGNRCRDRGPTLLGFGRMDRRTFVTGAAGLAVSASARGFAAPSVTSHKVYYVNSTKAGSDSDLSIGARPVNYTGRPANAVAINGGVPGPLLRWRQGDTVTLRVANRLGVD